MSNITGPMFETAQPNKVDQWTKLLLFGNAEEHPFLTMCKPSKNIPKGLETNWPVAIHGKIGANPKAEGDPIGDDEFHSQQRDSLRATCQKIREGYKVTTEAGLTQTYGVPEGELRFQKEAALTRFKMAAERRLLGDFDCVRNTAGNAYAMRTLFRWLEPDAAKLNSEYPIPEQYRVTDASCITGSSETAVTPDSIENMLLELKRLKGKNSTADMFCGPNLKSYFGKWGEYFDDGSSTKIPLKQYIQQASDSKYIRMVDTFQFSAGTLRAIEMLNLLCDANGEPTTKTNWSAAVIDMELFKLSFLQNFKHHELPFDGSGVRGFYDAIMLLECRMPRGNGRIIIDKA